MDCASHGLSVITLTLLTPDYVEHSLPAAEHSLPAAEHSSPAAEHKEDWCCLVVDSTQRTDSWSQGPWVQFLTTVLLALFPFSHSTSYFWTCVYGINFLDFQKHLSHKQEAVQLIAEHFPPSNHHYLNHLKRPLSTFTNVSKWKIWQRNRRFWILCGRTLPT